MGFATNNDFSFLQWLFTFNGILTIVILAGLIWMIFFFIQKNKSNQSQNQNENHFPPRPQYQNDSRYENEFADEKSFWDDLDKNEDVPQRNEEPIPPNAIPPSPTFKEEFGEEFSLSDELYEKDCSKSLELDMLDNVQLQYNPSQNNVEEKGE